MPILSNLDYPDVRGALDSDLSEKDLPDAFINRKIFAPAADQDVLDRDPDAETRTGADGERIKRAAIYFCAARLAPTVVRLTSLNVQTRDMSYQKPVFDPDERAAQLRNMAEEELAEVLSVEPARPEFFSVARGTRGK
jgi:hypothetical protein